MVVIVDGAELFYETRGTGFPCIVPSILGTTVFERLLPPPLTDVFTFVCVDLRGGGRSTGDPAALTFDVLAADLDAVRKDLGVSHVAVLGYSIMGVVALEYSRRSPETVSHAIMAGTPPTADLQELMQASTTFFDVDGSPDRKAILNENMARLPAGTPPTSAVLAQTPMRFFDPRADATELFSGVEFNARLSISTAFDRLSIEHRGTLRRFRCRSGFVRSQDATVGADHTAGDRLVERFSCCASDRITPSAWLMRDARRGTSRRGAPAALFTKESDMRKIVTTTFATMDGVMQAPGGPEEDTSGGFKHGGWQAKVMDDSLAAPLIPRLSEERRGSRAAAPPALPSTRDDDHLDR
jgi:pimeloyl-ACP methyl ester carboxylesterase